MLDVAHAGIDGWLFAGEVRRRVLRYPGLIVFRFVVPASSAHPDAVLTKRGRFSIPGSLPQQLQLAGVVGYVAAFAALIGYGRPGLGIGQLFYLPIVLVALAAGPRTGASAGALAGVLYVAALLPRAPVGWPELLSLRTGLHLVTYVAAGVIVGGFASRARHLLSGALHVLDDLLELAHRDAGSGALSARGLERLIAGRIARGWPFALLVAELQFGSDQAVRDAIRELISVAGEDVEVGRVAPAQIVLLVPASGAAASREQASELERLLFGAGRRASVGWAFYPAEGAESLSLYRAASERFYARRIVRGEWRPTAASAGLVEELVPGEL